ncbi:MAG TPA: ABC transporter permease [Chloroflexota bacterium]|nr:ABC transporter permease [Chloroflexota bacterium]
MATTIMPSMAGIRPLRRSRAFWVISDTLVLIQRSLLHIKEDPEQLLSLSLQPIMFVVLFRYVFGGAINTGGVSYANFLMAGIFVQTAAFGSTTTGVGLATDLQRGIIDRFRTLLIVQTAVLTGHVAADLIRSLLALAVMIVTGLLVGFRPTAGPLAWLAVIALLLLLTFALSWVSAIIGLMGKSIEFVQQASFIWLFPLTFASSAFVPTQSMPGWLRGFADAQPITHYVDAVRSLLLGQPVGNHGWLAAIWGLGILACAIPVASYQFRHQIAQ